GPVVSPHPSQLVRVLARPRMLLYGLAAMCYVGTEFAVVNWAPTFMEKGLGEPKSYSSLVMMLFFVCFTGGRLLASVVIHRLNQTATFTILCAGGILAMAAAFIFQIRIMGFDLFIPVTGFFLSAIFPILQNHVIHDFEGQMSLATGALYASSNIGASVMPFLIGALNDLFGVKGGIAVTGGILLLCLSAFLGAQYITHVKITEAEG
ncbi:MAG: MFS transporter, partial [Spirochaetota bacterium]